MTSGARGRGPTRWLDAGSFALGVLTEALAELRRARPAAPAAPASRPALVRIGRGRRRPRPARRRAEDRPRRREP